MLIILVELKVTDFDELEKFEAQVVAIMAKYKGRVLSAFELERKANAGIEVHVLSFPSKADFDNYLSDSALKELSGLRSKAIQSTKVRVSTKIKSYS